MIGSKLLSSGLNQQSVLAMTGDYDVGLTATGTSQTDALELDSALNVFTTVASGTGAKLKSADMGWFLVYNGGANPLNVYPWSGGAINSFPANQAVALPIRTACQFFIVSTTQAIGVLSA